MRRGSTLNSIEKNEIPVMISVRGEQYFDGVDPDATGLMTEGTLETTDTGLLLRYRESELTGMEGTETTFEIGPRRVILRRSGSVSSQMVFEEGQQHTSLYETPYGELTVDIQTSRLLLPAELLRQRLVCQRSRLSELHPTKTVMQLRRLRAQLCHRAAWGVSTQQIVQRWLGGSAQHHSGVKLLCQRSHGRHARPQMRHRKHLRLIEDDNAVGQIMELPALRGPVGI